MDPTRPAVSATTPPPPKIKQPPNPTHTHTHARTQQDPAFEPPALTDAVFDITVISGQQWLLFADPPITLEWTRDGRMAALESYTGAFVRAFEVVVVGVVGLELAGPPVSSPSPTSLSHIHQKCPKHQTKTGYLRLAVAPTDAVKQVLVDHWRAYPTGGDVLLDYQQEGMVTYQWRRKARHVG